MKILIVCEYFYPHLGGVEQVVYEVGKRLVRNQHRVTIFTTEEKISPTDIKLKKGGRSYFGFLNWYSYEGMTLIRLMTPVIFKRYLFPIIGFPFLLILSYRSDILHCANNYSIALACFLSGKLTGRKVTISVWEIWDRLWFSFYNFISASAYWLYEKLILSLPFDVFIAPSRFVYGQIINVNQNNKKIIKLGHKNIKPNKKRAAKLRKKYGKGKFIYFYYGRFGKSKGVEDLIAAFSKLAREADDVKLVLNISNLRETGKIINKLIKIHNIRHETEITGGISEEELEGYLTLADCVVTPDLTISFGLATLEASVMNKPVISSNGGALKEVAYGKVIFFKPGDTEDLLKALIKAKRGEFENIKDKNFSWDKTAQEYEQVFLTLITNSEN